MLTRFKPCQVAVVHKTGCRLRSRTPLATSGRYYTFGVLEAKVSVRPEINFNNYYVWSNMVQKK
jgi:hypothetical protein